MAKKFKSDSNVVKYIKKACPKISKSEFTDQFGQKTLVLQDSGPVQSFVYMTNQLHFLKVKFTDLTADLALAQKLNLEVCLKQRLPEDTHAFFDFTIDCRVVKKKLALINRYLPASNRLDEYMQNNFPFILDRHTSDPERQRIESIIFDLANAVNVLHNYGVILDRLCAESIWLDIDDRPFLVDPEHWLLPEDHWTSARSQGIWTQVLSNAEDGFTADIYKLGLVFFQILNGVKAREFLEATLSGTFGNSQDFLNRLEFPGNFVWMRHMLSAPSVRLEANQVVRGVAQSISIQVTFEDFQARWESNESEVQQAHRKGVDDAQFSTIVHHQSVLVEDHLMSAMPKSDDKVYSLDSVSSDSKERFFRSNNPSRDYRTAQYKIGSLMVKYAVNRGKNMFLV